MSSNDPFKNPDIEAKYREREIEDMRRLNAAAREKRIEAMKGLAVLTAAVLILLGIIIGLVVGWQKFKVYSQEQEGRAILAKAQFTRQVATLDAQAEIARARGVAESNRIIGDSLKGKDEYLRYLYITGMQHTSNQVIYVPTEGALPVLEAGRLNATPPKGE